MRTLLLALILAGSGCVNAVEEPVPAELLDVSGNYTSVLMLTYSSCPSDDRITATKSFSFHVVQVDMAVVVPLERVQLDGLLTSDGMEATGSYLDHGATVDLAYVLSAATSDLAYGEIATTITYGPFTCDVVYEGDLYRERIQ